MLTSKKLEEITGVGNGYRLEQNIITTAKIHDITNTIYKKKISPKLEESGSQNYPVRVAL